MSALLTAEAELPVTVLPAMVPLDSSEPPIKLTTAQLQHLSHHSVVTQSSAGPWVELHSASALQSFHTDNPNWEGICYTTPLGGLVLHFINNCDMEESSTPWADAPLCAQLSHGFCR